VSTIDDQYFRAMVEQAGLGSLSTDELAALGENYEILQGHLETVRQLWRLGGEPATRFVAAEPSPLRETVLAPGADSSARSEESGLTPAISQRERESVRSSSDLPYLRLAEVASLIRSRQLSPLELATRMLERIETENQSLHAFVTVTADLALGQARATEADIMKGEYRGPLHGIPLAVKDIYETRGIGTTAHSRVLLDWVPDRDATCITRLYESGAVLLGKLATAEFATGSVLEGPFPPARNPWNLEHVPGISSSGSASAVAGGLCFGSLGSDTGGSVRGPSSLCGIVGLRPTYGRVSRHGVLPLAWSLDTAGPMARSVTDCALLLQAIAGHDPNDPTSADVGVPNYAAALTPDLRGMTVGVDREHFFTERVAPETVEVVEAAIGVLGELGAEVVGIDLPMLDYATASMNIIHASEAHAYHAERIRSTPELYGATVRNYFRLGAFIGAADYLQAQRVRQHIRSEMLAAFERVHLIAAPTYVSPARRFDEMQTGERFKRGNLTLPFSLAGAPAISVPCGFSGAGLPIGLQLAGRPFDESSVLRAAYAYEQATPWHTMHPPLSWVPLAVSQA
jgi:aspartyl-tRNA(Asn)/glutamyl-tRNA(Gln) amidotransferase subunit A